MTPILTAFTAALLHFAWQGLLVFVLLWPMLFGLRKHSANARYAASCLALATLVAAPLLTTWSLYRQPVATAPRLTALALPSPVAVTPTARPPQSQTHWLASAQFWVLPVWAVGVLAFSLRMLYGWAQVADLRRRGHPADIAVLETVAMLRGRLRLTRPVRVLISAWEGGPSLVGWLRPVILIPASAATGLTPQQLEAVLAHELAHVRRHDYLVNWIQLLVETLLFYHPAVWWISSRIRHERELCCDDLAVSACEGPMCYARALTSLEKLRAATPTLAVGATGGPLLYRIQRIMGVTTETCGPSRASGLVALIFAVACLVVSANWARGQNQPQPELLTQGDALMRDGAYEPALQKYKQGMAEDQARRATYQKRSIEVLMRMGNRAEAAQINAQLLKELPGDIDGLAVGAAILLDQGEVAAAINQLRQVIERVPDNAVAYLNLGRAYAAQHEDAAARREFEEAIRLRPDFARAKEELAKLGPATQQLRGTLAVPEQSDSDSALSLLQSESEKAPERVDLSLALGNTAARAGKYDLAIFTFQRMLDRMDQSSNQRGDIYLRLGEVYRRKGDAAAAVQALQKARELLPDNRMALIALIMSLESLGRHAEAQQLRDEADEIKRTREALTTNFLKNELAFEEKRLEALQARPKTDSHAIAEVRWELEEKRRRLQAAVAAAALGPEWAPVNIPGMSPGKYYFITGEVGRPGAFSLTVPTRVLEALVNAGGFREAANSSDIVIMHATGERERFNYQDLIAGKNVEQNVFLKPGDIIIVK